MVCASAPLSHNNVFGLSCWEVVRGAAYNVMLRFHQVLRRASISNLAGNGSRHRYYLHISVLFLQ